MEEQNNNQGKDNLLMGIMAGFATLLVFFAILGSSFNEVMMLGLFFLFLAIGITYYIENNIDNDDDSEDES